MCYDSLGGELERQAAEPDAPSRRAFSRLLLAGTGLAALSACSPAQSHTPSGTPGPTPAPAPTPGSGSGERQCDALRRGCGVGVPASGWHAVGVPSGKHRGGSTAVGRGAGAAAFTLGPHESVGDRQQAPAARPRHLRSA